MGSFWPQHILFELKKYGEVILHDTEEWCSKILRKADMRFGKWQEEFGKFSQEHWKVSKLDGIWWDPFIQSRKCMNLKFVEELCVMTMTNNAKFEEELTLLQNWHEEFAKFSPGHSSCKNLHLNELFLTKVYDVELKKYSGVMFDSPEDWCKIWRKTNLCFQKWHEEFGKFSLAKK